MRCSWQALAIQRIPQAGERLSAALVESGVGRWESDDRSVEENEWLSHWLKFGIARHGRNTRYAALLAGNRFVYAPLINVEVDLAKLEVVLHISGARTHDDPL
jgi:hypothetical protein